MNIYNINLIATIHPVVGQIAKCLGHKRGTFHHKKGTFGPFKKI